MTQHLSAKNLSLESCFLRCGGVEDPKAVVSELFDVEYVRINESHHVQVRLVRYVLSVCLAAEWL